jgi:hypothetical protein
MKKITLLLLPLLSSCAIYDAVTTSHFDNNEYQHIVDIRNLALTGKTFCKDPVESLAFAGKVASKTQMFMIYEEHLSSNVDAHKAAKVLDEIAQGLVKRYSTPPVSETFCKIKFDSIQNAAGVLQHVIGNRPR